MENENQKLVQLEKYIGEHFLLVDKGIVRLLCAMVIANRLPGDPVWLFVVAPSSSMKTELLNALSSVDSIYSLSSLTPKTFASGARVVGGDPSLLMELQTGKIITFKDFTTILQMNYNVRDEILSQLREIYDGKFSKRFGNGVEVNWEGKLGFLAGVTDVIENYQGRISVMGERFVQYRVRQPDRKEAARMGLRNSEDIQQIRETLKSLFKDLIDGMDIPNKADIPVLPREMESDLIELSEFATTARAGVERDYRDREITNVFPPEMPVRFAKQLILLCKAFHVLGSFGELEKSTIRHIAMSSVPRTRRKVILMLAKPRGSIDLAGKETVDEVDDFGFEDDTQVNQHRMWMTKDIGLALNLPTTTSRRACEELTALGITNRIKVRKNLDGWELRPEYKLLIDKHYSGYETE